MAIEIIDYPITTRHSRGGERVTPFSPGSFTGSDLPGRERFSSRQLLGIPLAVLLAAACAGSKPPEPSPTPTLPPVPTITPIPIGGGDRLICDSQGVIVKEDGKTLATPFPTEEQIKKFNKCVIKEALTGNMIQQIGEPQKDKDGKEIYPEGSIIRSFQLIALNGIPSSLPEGKRESEKQGINNTGIPRLQRAVDALRSGDIAKAGEMIADEIESLQLTSSDMLRRYSNLKLDANGDRMVDYLEGVYRQIQELEKQFKMLSS